MQVIRVVNRVICEPVSTGLIPHLLGVRNVEVRPHTRKANSSIVRLPKPCGRRGCWLRARLRCAECGCFPGWDTWCAESGGFPGRDWRCAEDGCSPDESNYYVLDDYCSANSQDALSMYINVLLSYNCKWSAEVPTLRRHSPRLWEPNKPY